jgi:surface-anchored protein
MSISRRSNKAVVLEALETRLNPSSIFNHGHVDLEFNWSVPAGATQPAWETGIHRHEDGHEHGDEEGLDEIWMYGTNFQRQSPSAQVRTALGLNTDDPLWILDSTVTNEEKYLKLGIAAEETDPANLSSVTVFDPRLSGGTATGKIITVTLDKVDFVGQGQGEVFMYQDLDQVWFNSSDSLDPGVDRFFLTAGGHSDTNWAFTQPGNYSLQFTAIAMDSDGATIVSEPFMVSIRVGGTGFQSVLAAGVGAGAPPNVVVNFPSAQGISEPEKTVSFFAYDPKYLGGVVTAVGNISGGESPDVVTAPAIGAPGPHITVRNMGDLSVVASFYAYAREFQGGTVIASGDVDGDGYGDVIVGTKSGGSHVAVFSGYELSLGNTVTIASWFAFDNWKGGVRITADDLDGDGNAEVVAACGVGARPHVTVWKWSGAGKTMGIVSSYYAYDGGFKGGVNLGTGDWDNNGIADVITGSGIGAEATIVVFRAATNQVMDAFFPFEKNPAWSKVARDKGVQVGSIRNDVLGGTRLLVAPVAGVAGALGEVQVAEIDPENKLVAPLLWAPFPGFAGSIVFDGRDN